MGKLIISVIAQRKKRERERYKEMERRESGMMARRHTLRIHLKMTYFFP
jgi:hypothetical protein